MAVIASSAVPSGLRWQAMLAAMSQSSPTGIGRMKPESYKVSAAVATVAVVQLSLVSQCSTSGSACVETSVVVVVVVVVGMYAIVTPWSKRRVLRRREE